MYPNHLPSAGRPGCIHPHSNLHPQSLLHTLLHGLGHKEQRRSGLTEVGVSPTPLEWTMCLQSGGYSFSSQAKKSEGNLGRMLLHAHLKLLLYMRIRIHMYTGHNTHMWYYIMIHKHLRYYYRHTSPSRHIVTIEPLTKHTHQVSVELYLVHP